MTGTAPLDVSTASPSESEIYGSICDCCGLRHPDRSREFLALVGVTFGSAVVAVVLWFVAISLWPLNPLAGALAVSALMCLPVILALWLPGWRQSPGRHRGTDG